MMITSVHDWLVLLRGTQPLVGFPLLLGGMGLLLFGWRMWKLCVALSFCLIGAGVGSYLAGPGEYQTYVAIGSGLVLGLLSYWPVNYSVSLLGGLIGATFLANFLAGMGLGGPMLWVAGGVALFGCSAVAFLNRASVVIVVTAFLGASLLLSGLAVFVMRTSTLYGTLHSMATNHAIVVPFLLLVPTVMSCFYQTGEARRSHVEA